MSPLTPFSPLLSTPPTSLILHNIPGPMACKPTLEFAGQDFVSHDFWPEEMQGGFIKARYKPTNKIEFHTWTEEDDHFSEKFQFDLIFSTNLSFIPVDLNFRPTRSLLRL
jgi:hypothetical protein